MDSKYKLPHCLLSLMLGLGMSLVSARANEFVGVLSLAVDEEVAAELGISESTVERLAELIDKRESEAIAIAYELRDLSEAEQFKKLTPFRKRSEQAGLALLSEQQRRRSRGDAFAADWPGSNLRAIHCRSNRANAGAASQGEGDPGQRAART